VAASIQSGQRRRPHKGQRERALLFWIKRGLQASVIGLPTLAIAGTIYQLVATKIDQRKLGPAPGEMVSVGSHKLHINCMGQGSPPVILESGTPGTSVEWSAWVQPEIAKATRVCAYDRAGLGWSEAGPGPRDAEQITSEMHTLLENAGIEGPYVLVGHSVGGHHVRVYADRYPDEVAGMVLVDATHPEQFERIPEMESGRRMLGVMSRVGPVLAATGVIRLSGMFPPPPDLPPLQRKQGENLTYQTSHLITAFKEYRALPEAMEQARSTHGLGDKPLAVVSASDHGGGMMAGSRVEAEHSEQAAQALQSELANLSSNSTHRVIEGSDHGSVITNRRHAQQTSEEILKVVEVVRTGQPLEEH
jgi:pimeloyl-ACP methyl ester carboxylesterase